MFLRSVPTASQVYFVLLSLLVLLWALPTPSARADSPILAHVQTLVGPAGVAPDLKADGLAHTAGMAWSPDGNFLYLTDSNNHAVLALRRNSTTGEMILVDTVVGNDLHIPVNLVISPDSRHVYVINEDARDHPSVVVFQRDQVEGHLSYVEGHYATGSFTRDIAISPDGMHLYVVSDQSFAILKRDSTTGKLTILNNPSTQYGAITISKDGKFVYLASLTDAEHLEVFTRDSASGALTLLEAHKNGTGGVEGLCDSPCNLTISPDGTSLYAAGDTNMIAIFKRTSATGKLTFVKAEKNGLMGTNLAVGVSDITISPDGQALYLTGIEHIFSPLGPTISQKAVLFHFGRNSNTSTLNLVQTYRAEVLGVPSLAGVNQLLLTADGTQLYAAGAALSRFIRNTTTGGLTFSAEQKFSYPNVGYWGPTSGTVSPDGKNIYLATNGEEYVRTAADDTVTVLERNPLTVTISVVQVLRGSPCSQFVFCTINFLGPTSATVSPDGKNVYVSHYWSGVAVYQRNKQGLLTLVERKYYDQDNNQSIYSFLKSVVSPDGKYLYVAVAKIEPTKTNPAVLVFARNATDGSLTEVQSPSFVVSDSTNNSGTASIAISADGNHLYATNTLGNALALFTRDFASGKLTLVEILQDGVNGLSGLTLPGEVVISSDGKNVYVLNRTDKYVTTFTRDSTTGKVTVIPSQGNGSGDLWRVNSITLSQDGSKAYVAGLRLTNNDPENPETQGAIGVFRRNAVTGVLIWLGTLKNNETGVDKLSRPSGLIISPDDQHLYALSTFDNAVTVLRQSAEADVLLANGDAIELPRGKTASMLTSGDQSVLQNDTGPLSTTLSATLFSNPKHGSLVLHPNGTFVYTHDGSDTTSDFFTYRATDGVQSSNVATVTITITPTTDPPPINQPPVARNDSLVVKRRGSTQVLDGGAASVLANDSDAENNSLTAVLVSPPQHGALQLNTDGTLTYAHDGSTTSSDAFTYRASDGGNQSNLATVAITVRPADPPPTTPVASFVFSKTVGIAGISPTCTRQGTMKVPVGTAVAYCYTIRNTGNVALTTHTLVDSHIGLILDSAAYDLPPGLSYSKMVTQALQVSTTNIATWTATINGAVTAADLALPAAGTANAKTAATVIISGPTDDQDQDSIPDNMEGWLDPDRDNLPNFLDLDADGDALPDQAEVGTDPAHPQDEDNDGVPDFLDAQLGNQPPSNVFLTIVRR